jgi:class 3 adenylate cyclase
MDEIEARADGDIAGIAVHTASRLTDHARSDEILVSRVIGDLLAGTGVELVDRGSHQPKGLPTPVQIHASHELRTAAERKRRRSNPVGRGRSG